MELKTARLRVMRNIRVGTGNDTTDEVKPSAVQMESANDLAAMVNFGLTIDRNSSRFQKCSNGGRKCMITIRREVQARKASTDFRRTRLNLSIRGVRRVDVNIESPLSQDDLRHGSVRVHRRIV